MTFLKASKILKTCRAVITHFTDLSHSSVRALIRWYDRRGRVVGRAIVTKFLSSVSIYSGRRVTRFARPDEVSTLLTLGDTKRTVRTHLRKTTPARTKAYIKRLVGDDSIAGQVLAFTLRQSEGKQYIMDHFKAAA